MNHATTAANAEISNTPRGASVGVRQQIPLLRERTHAFTVRWDPYERGLSVSKGYIAALKVCPDNRLIIPQLPEIDPDKTGTITEEKNIIFDGGQFSADQEYDIIAVIHADPEKSNYITFKEHSDDETSEDIEECQRYFKIAKFKLTEENGDKQLLQEDLEQIWESDIIMPWEDLSEKCCTPDSDSSDESSGEGDSDSLSEDGSGSDDDSESDDSESSSEGSAGCICPKGTEISVLPRVVEVGTGGYKCFSTGLVEEVWIAVDVILPKSIQCNSEFGDLTGALFKMSFTNSAQEWWGFNKLDYFMYPLAFGPGSTPNNDIVGTLVRVPASCGQWKILSYWIEIQKGTLGNVRKQTCTYNTIKMKMPGILIADEYCSACTNENDGPGGGYIEV